MKYLIRKRQQQIKLRLLPVAQKQVFAVDDIRLRDERRAVVHGAHGLVLRYSKRNIEGAQRIVCFLFPIRHETPSFSPFSAAASRRADSIRSIVYYTHKVMFWQA